MKARLILVSLGLVALTILSFGLQAQPPKGTTQDSKDDIITNEQQLARQFAEFQDALLRLKQRLARGTPEEKKRADVLGKVLDECRNLAINQEFTKMLEILRTANVSNTGDVDKLKNQSETIATRLRKILDLMQDSKGDSLTKDRKDLEQIIKDLQKAIDRQKQVQGQTDLGKTDKDELNKNQKDTTEKTAKVEKDIQKYLDKDGKGQEAANLKGGPKDGGKGDGKKGEAKDAGKQASEGKKGETKDAGKDSQGGKKGEAKPGEAKDKQADKSPDAEPKAGNKAGEKSGSDPKEAGAKSSKAGDPKKDGPQGAAKGNPGEKKDQQGGAKDAGKSGDPKKDGPQGSAKAGGDDKKPGGEKNKPNGPDSQAKPGQKPGSPEAKQAGAKEAKGGAKGSEAKPGGDPKGGEGKQGEAKSGDSKDGKGQAKGGGSPPNPNAPPQSQPQQASDKGDGQPPPPGGAKKQDDDVAKSAKKIKEAGYDQKAAEENIKKENKTQASKNQGDAIDKMEAAKKKLEKLLQQMREEEIERVLAALQARCEKMLMMQMQVLAGTEDTEKVIARNSDKKPTRENKQESLKLADKEKEIVQEANKCIDILEAEGSAVAFPEVFQQIRQDMIHVQKRLELTDVADQTQGIERDIIDTLKEMIEALKKARQENSDPSKSPPGKAGKPGDQKLLELIQELKMVRSLQKRVNDRTTDYGKRYAGEQANDAQVVRNLRQLAERQLRIQEIVSRISKGDNK